MIKVTPQGDKPPFSEDIKVPTVLNETDRINISNFHDWVRDSDVEIYIPSAFGTIVTMLAAPNTIFDGDGAPYVFYFDTAQARDDFLAIFNEL